jgi:hypothetical protein
MSEPEPEAKGICTACNETSLVVNGLCFFCDPHRELRITEFSKHQSGRCVRCGNEHTFAHERTDGLCPSCAYAPRQLPVPDESPRQRLERHLDGSYQPGVLIDLLSRTLLSELDALNARLDGIEKRLPVIQNRSAEPSGIRVCGFCIHEAVPQNKVPCSECFPFIGRPNFERVSFSPDSHCATCANVNSKPTPLECRSCFTGSNWKDGLPF